MASRVVYGRTRTSIHIREARCCFTTSHAGQKGDSLKFGRYIFPSHSDEHASHSAANRFNPLITAAQVRAEAESPVRRPKDGKIFATVRSVLPLAFIAVLLIAGLDPAQAAGAASAPADAFRGTKQSPCNVPPDR